MLKGKAKKAAVKISIIVKALRSLQPSFRERNRRRRVRQVS